MTVSLTSFKQSLHAGLTAVAQGADPALIYHSNAQLWASHPFNQLQGLEAIRRVWSQLRYALPDMQRRDQIFVAGNSKADARMPDDL